MRIAYLLADPGIGVFGTKGASVHVQEMIRAFRAHGHEVTVYCVRCETQVPEDLRDLRVVTVPVRAAKGAAERESRVAEAARMLADLAAAEDFDLVYERYSLFSDAGAHAAAELTERRGRRVPLVVEVNAPLVEEQRDHRVLHDELGARAATRRALDHAEIVSCVSEPVAAWARAAAPGAARRVMVLPNGVNTRRIRRAGRAPGAPFTVGFVGTLKPWHGTGVLLEAFAAAARRDDGSGASDGSGISRGTRATEDSGGSHGAAGWRLEICGKGPELEPLRARAHELGLDDRVRFHGAVAPQDVPEILAGMDVAVAPYPHGDHYFSPLKVYEYMAAGLPVVASAIGDLPGLLGDDERGLLVPPGNVEALAAALHRLAYDRLLRERLARAGRATAVAEHDWSLRCAELLTRLGLPARQTLPVRTEPRQQEVSTA